MARMEMRSREAPMEWEREQDRNLPNIFANPPQPVDPHASPLTSNQQQQHQQQTPFGFGVQRGSSFASQSSQNDGRESSTPKPFRQDSQLSTGGAATPRQGSFSFGQGTGGGSFSHPHSPNITTPQDLTTTTDTMEVDEHPQHIAKAGGGEAFDMGSLRNGVVGQGPSPRRMLGNSRTTSSQHGSALVGSKNSNMQYRGGAAAANRRSSFWSDGDEDDVVERDEHEDVDMDEADSYNRHGFGRPLNRNKSRTTDNRRQFKDQDNLDRRVSEHGRSPAQGRVWTENVDLPYIIAGYVQVAMNTAYAGIGIYVLYNFYTTIQSDVSIRAENTLKRETQAIANCKKDYYETYKCNGPYGPALIMTCAYLSECIERPDPKIERAKMAAQTFAVIVNSFVNTISYKTMAFLMMLVFGLIYFSNHAISSYRHKHVLEHQDPIAHSNLPSGSAADSTFVIPSGLKRNDSNGLSFRQGAGMIRQGSSTLTGRGAIMLGGVGGGGGGPTSRSLTLQRYTLLDSDNE
ncbi:hypothetical protein BGX29_005547 [Mortierella sp. GBA35]|nr:hypothetical protein BGX23_011867 [Mortierella sp. AD031]KAF9101502.1 hypothetical protein BGX29_005547 [Mortierella sp. GBA35]KAG0215175.1 hypothetical protein BGX33_001407 [Mortierella sp. NVP41]